MAIEADKVVTILEIQKGSFDKDAKDSARVFGQSVSSIEKDANRVEKAIATTSARTQAATRNIARQFQDIGAQAGSGQSFFVIMSQQLPQLADAVADTEGKFAGFARFLLNPWVAAGLAAASALVPIITKSLETGEGIDKLVAKMKEQAKQAELNERADAAWKRTIDGLTESIRKRYEEQQKALQTDRQAMQQSLDSARAEAAQAEKELKKREDRLAVLYKRLMDFENSPSGKDVRGGGTDVIAELKKEIERLERERIKLVEDVIKAQRTVRGAEIDISERDVAGRLDAVTAATNAYTDALGRLRHERNRGRISEAEFERQLEAEGRKLKAAVKAAQESERAAKTGPDGDNTRFLNPVGNGPISGAYGTNRGTHTHAGIDIGVASGTRVAAAAGGTVIEAGTLPGYGNVIIIDHGRGTVTRYAHLSKIGVVKGQVVDAGDQIGLSGGVPGTAGAGNSKGAHLHYEVRRNGKPVDPRTGLYPTDPASVRSGAERVAREAEQLADRRAANESQFQDKLKDYDIALADARKRQVQTAEEAAAAEEAAINARAAAAAQDIEQQRDKLKRDDAANALTYDIEAAILLAKNEELRGLNIRNAREKEQQRLDIERLKLAEGVLRDAAEVDQARLDLAETTSERREIALRLLEYDRQIELAKIDELLANKELSKAERERLEAQKGRVNTIADLRRQGLERQYESPIARYSRSLNLTPEQIRERAEQAAVDELQYLRDGLVDGLTEELGIKDPLIRQLVGMFIDQVIMKPIAQALANATAQGGGVAGFFSSLLTSVGSLFGGGGGSPTTTTPPGFAAGGSMILGGRGGIDQNTLSLNGHDIARVSAGEVLNFVPPNARASRAGGRTNIYQINVSADNSVTPSGFAERLATDILTAAQRMDRQASMETLRQVPATLGRSQRMGTL